jgi:hypothetical protein
MPTCLLSDIFNDVRGILSDTQVAGGEIFTNTYLPVHFAEPYRTMFGKLLGSSKRVQRVFSVVLPALNSVLIPANYNILDLAEPEMLEERPATPAIAITSTNTSSPIQVTAPGHGLSTGTEGAVGRVANTYAPWGNWYITVVDANNFTLNGSMTDGVAGTGGFFYPETLQEWSEVSPVDLTAGGLDGIPTTSLGCYLWINELFQFRGATVPTELRITYNASGTAPTNPTTTIGIDNCRDFLGYATAANAARSKGWWDQYERLHMRAYGNQENPDDGLLDIFWRGQVMMNQRGPQRRQQPFRAKRSRYGTYLLG